GNRPDLLLVEHILEARHLLRAVGDESDDDVLVAAEHLAGQARTVMSRRRDLGADVTDHAMLREQGASQLLRWRERRLGGEWLGRCGRCGGSEEKSCEQRRAAHGPASSLTLFCRQATPRSRGKEVGEE